MTRDADWKEICGPVNLPFWIVIVHQQEKCVGGTVDNYERFDEVLGVNTDARFLDGNLGEINKYPHENCLTEHAYDNRFDCGLPNSC